MCAIPSRIIYLSYIAQRAASWRWPKSQSRLSPLAGSVAGHTRAYKGIQGHTRAYNTIQTVRLLESSPRPIIFRISANATHRYQDGVRPVSVCLPLWGWGWDGFKINKQWRKQTPETFNAYQGHLLTLTVAVAVESWQFMLDHFQCSNVPMFQCSNVPMFQCSNVPMYVKETEAHTFGHSAIRHQLQPQIQVLPRGECRECREQGTRETSHAQHILQPNMAHTHLPN
jgi:hypothetical protein